MSPSALERTRSTRRRAILISAAILGLAAGASSQSCLVIGGFDTSRGGPNGIMASNTFALQNSIKGAFPGTGFSVAPVLTPFFLAQLDVLYLDSFTSAGCCSGILPLTPGEQAALVTYVHHGGDAILVIDNGAVASTAIHNSLVGPFGFSSSATSLTGPQTAAYTGVQSTVLQGPFGPTSPLTTVGPGWLSTLPAAAEVLATLTNNNQPVLAEIPAGALTPTSGRVMVLADSDCHSSLAFEAMALNILSDVADPFTACWRPSGPNCTGPSSGPGIYATGTPHLGNQAFSLVLIGAPPLGQTEWYIADVVQIWSLPLAGGCSVHLELSSLMGYASFGLQPFYSTPATALGTAAMYLPIPNDPTLAGVSLAFQALVADPGATLGFTLTNAAAIGIW